MAVVGAHLSGQPLNWQMTMRKARLIRTVRTHPDYRLYVLLTRSRLNPASCTRRGLRGRVLS